MAEKLDDAQALESTTVWINRTSTTVKGGRRLGFAALVVVGDRNGSVGVGYGKGRGVPVAIEKAQKDARKQMFKVKLNKSTLPHPVTGRFGASKIRLIPAAPGTGVIAGGTARAVLEMAGIHDCLSKSYGSSGQRNLCEAVVAGLKQLKTREQFAQLRGVEIGETEVDDKLTQGQRFMPTSSGEEKAQAPTNTVGEKNQKGGRGRRGGGGGRGRGRGGDQGQAQPQETKSEGGDNTATATAQAPAESGGEGGSEETKSE